MVALGFLCSFSIAIHRNVSCRKKDHCDYLGDVHHSRTAEVSHDAELAFLGPVGLETFSYLA